MAKLTEEEWAQVPPPTEDEWAAEPPPVEVGEPEVQGEGGEWGMAEKEGSAAKDVAAAAIHGAKGATGGFLDELIGVANALYPANPAGPTPPEKAEIRPAVEEYRSGKAQTEEALKRTAAESPIASKVGGGVDMIASAIIPGTGAAKGLQAAKGLAAVGKAGVQGLKQGVGWGALGGLGASEADLTKGEVGQAVADTALGGAIGGAAGGLLGATGSAGVLGVKKLMTALSTSKKYEALAKFMRGIVTRDGPVETQRKVAGEAIKEAVEKGGDNQIPVSKFARQVDDLYTAQNPEIAGGKEIEHDLAALHVNEHDLRYLNAQRSKLAEGQGPTLTLAEIQKRLHYWGKEVSSREGHDKQVASIIYKSLVDDLAAVDDTLADVAQRATSGADTVAEAAKKLREGRSAYATAMNAQALDDIVTRSERLGSNARGVDPKTLLSNTTRDKRADVEKLFIKGYDRQGNPQIDTAGLARWRSGIAIAEGLVGGGEKTFGFPTAMFGWRLTPKVNLAAKALFSLDNAHQVFADPKYYKEFTSLLAPSVRRSEQKTLDVLARLTARLSGEATSGAIDLEEESPAYRKSTQ